jgi:hypothetical protein
MSGSDADNPNLHKLHAGCPLQRVTSDPETCYLRAVSPVSRWQLALEKATRTEVVSVSTCGHLAAQ